MPRKRKTPKYEPSSQSSAPKRVSLIQDSPFNPFTSGQLYDSESCIFLPKGQNYSSGIDPTYLKPSRLSELIMESPADFTQCIDQPVSESHQHKLTVSSVFHNQPPSLQTSLSKHLAGMDVDINDNDLEYILYKESLDIYKELKSRKSELLSSLKNAKTKLKLCEDDYRYKVEERNLSKTDFLSLCDKLLKLPADSFPFKLVQLIQKSDLNPEELFPFREELRKILQDLIIEGLGRKDTLENELKQLPSKQTIKLLEKLLKELESEKDSLSQQIKRLETQFAVPSITVQSPIAAEPSDEAIKDSPALEAIASPEKISLSLETTLEMRPDQGTVQQDTIKEAAACTSPDLNLEEIAADVVRDVLNQKETKISDLPLNLANQLYRAQLYIQRKILMLKSGARLKKILGL